MKRQFGIGLLLVLAIVFGPVAAQARYLNPNTGRFQTMDSYEGKRDQPFSLHKFLYVSANPVNGIDPSGNQDINTTQVDGTIRSYIGAALVTGVITAYVVAKQLPPVSVAEILTRTRTRPVPIPVDETEPQPKDKKPKLPWPPIWPDEYEDPDKLYRGIPKTREPDYTLALSGIAKPRGNLLDVASLEKHVRNEDVASGVTSWTLSRPVAYRFSGSDGVILEIDVYSVLDRFVARPPIAQNLAEHEILLKGTIYGARPTRP